MEMTITIDLGHDAFGEHQGQRVAGILHDVGSVATQFVHGVARMQSYMPHESTRITFDADAIAEGEHWERGGEPQAKAPVLEVPNKTETPKRYARRALYDLAHILEHLDTENWDNLDERRALLSGLETHAKVLRKLANHIEEGGQF